MAASQSESRLLRLPGELRELIYIKTLEDSVIQVDGTECRRAPGLLMSCRQIYCEAIRLYYKYTTFFFVSGRKGFRWLKKISRSHLEAINRVLFDTATSHMHLFGVACTVEDVKVALAVFNMELLDHRMKLREGVLKASVERDDGTKDWSVEFPRQLRDVTCVQIQQWLDDVDLGTKSCWEGRLLALIDRTTMLFSPLS